MVAATRSQVRAKRRGRPRRDEPSGERLRQQVIESARGVYAQHGEQGLSVALILEAARISRPTFYRLFNGTSELCETLVAEANQSLRTRILGVLLTRRPPETQLRAVIGAYFEWAAELGAMTHALYRDIAHPGTHANRAREQLIAEFVQLLREQARLLERAAPEPLLADAALRALEYVCSAAFATGTPDAATLQTHRAVAEQMMLRLLLPDAEASTGDETGLQRLEGEIQ